MRRLLAEEDFAYQQIELPFGLSTGGADRSATARAILPDDLRGKSVLDVGAKYGYFCFEAARRGADRVVGVDVAPDSVRKARLLADCLGHKVSFERLDIETQPIRETFDTVLCLNLLHHLRDPIGALETLSRLARERLVLEVAALGGHDRRKVKVSRLAGFFLGRAPVIFVSRNGTSGKRSVQKFFITKGALENLLVHHRKLFARVDLLPTEHKDRYLAIAHRRRIGRLCVVTGPTASGKSTLIEKLSRGDAPEVAERAGLSGVRGWPTGGTKDLARLTEPELPGLLFHYDFLRPYMRSAKVHTRDEGLDVLDCAERSVILTIWRPPEVLLAQLRRGEIAPRTTLGVYWGKKRHKKLLEEYADPATLCDHYRRWFEFTRGRADEHLVLDPAEPGRFFTPDEWERKVAPA